MRSWMHREVGIEVDKGVPWIRQHKEKRAQNETVISTEDYIIPNLEEITTHYTYWGLFSLQVLQNWKEEIKFCLQGQSYVV